MNKAIALIILAASFSGCIQFKTRSGYEGGIDATGDTVKGHASDPVGNQVDFDVPKVIGE